MTLAHNVSARLRILAFVALAPVLACGNEEASDPGGSGGSGDPPPEIDPAPTRATPTT